MRIEVVSFHSVGQRQLILSLAAFNADELLVFEDCFEGVLGPYVMCASINEVSLLVNSIAIQVLVVHHPQSSVLIDNLSIPVALESAHYIILIERSLIQQVAIFPEESLNVFNLRKVVTALGLRVLLE